MSVTLPTILSYTKALSYSAEYTVIYNAMTNKPDETNAGYQNAMVESLVAGGYWARMDWLYVFATNNEANSLINWVNPGTYDADNVSATSFTAYEGFTGDGSADYISTNWNPNDNGTNFTLNSSSIGVYTRTNNDDGVNYLLGVYSGTGPVSCVLTPSNNTNMMVIMGTGSALAASGANVSRPGFYIGTRTSSTAVYGYKNGGLIASNTSSNSVALPDYEFTILRRGNATGYSINQVSIAFVMDAVVSEAEAGAINTIMETYMDAIGKGVE